MKKAFTLPLVYLVLVYLVLASTAFAQSGNPITESTNQFLATLGADELTKTQYAFTDSLRFKWTNLPVGMVPRPGIAYGSLSDKSRMAFHRVLSAMLSSQGYLKTTSIMQLDDILNTLYQQAFDSGEIDQKVLKMTQDLKWAHGNYYISIWGKLLLNQPWGLNFGGHHMALSLLQSHK